MNRKTSFIILVLLLSPYFLFAQDSIKQKTQILQNGVDSAVGDDKLKSYQNLLDYVVKNQPLKVLSIAENGIDLAKQLNNTSAEVGMILTVGLSHAKLHEPLKALNYYAEAYQLAIKISDSAAICKTLIQMGAAKITKGDINQSIEHFIAAEKIAEKIDNRILLVDAINYLGVSYYLIDNLDEALKFSDKAFKLSNELNYEEGKALAYEHFVIVYVKQEKFAEALELNSKALKIRKELDDLQSISGLYYNFSVIYSRLKDFKKAIEYTKKSIDLRKSYGNINGVGSNYLTLGNIYLRSNQNDSALVYLTMAYDIKIGTGDNRAITSIVKSLSDVYEKKNNFKSAHKYLREYKTYSDSLFGEDSRRLSSKILAQRELVRKEDEIKHLQSINEYQSEVQKLLIIVIVLSVLLSIAFIVLYIINRKAKNNLALKNKELISLNKDKEKFFRIITHDLRSPFHPLIGYTDAILNNINTMNRDEIKIYTDEIHTSAKQILNLMDNLLHWLGFKTNKMEYNPVDFDINPELENTLKLFTNNFKSKSLIIQNIIQKQSFVYADRTMVGIIFRNLISNAFKFSNENGIIKILSERKEKFLEISIQDNGTGIPENQLNEIFSNEMKSTKGTNGETGTGLGLLLCKEMTELNGGKLSIESKIDIGTTIRFSLAVSDKNL